MSYCSACCLGAVLPAVLQVGGSLGARYALDESLDAEDACADVSDNILELTVELLQSQWSSTNLEAHAVAPFGIRLMYNEAQADGL